MISNIPYEDKDFERAFDTDNNTHTKIDLGKYRVCRVSYVATDNPRHIEIKTRNTADVLGIEIYDPTFNCYLVIASVEWSEEDQFAKINAVEQRLATAIVDARAYVIDTVDLYYALNRTLAYINHRHNKEYSYEYGITALDMFDFLDQFSSLGYDTIDISKLLTQQLINPDLFKPDNVPDTLTVKEIADLISQLVEQNFLIVNYQQFFKNEFNSLLDEEHKVNWQELICKILISKGCKKND